MSGPQKCHRGNLRETKDAVNRNEIVLYIRFIPPRYLFGWKSNGLAKLYILWLNYTASVCTHVSEVAIGNRRQTS